MSMLAQPVSNGLVKQTLSCKMHHNHNVSSVSYVCCHAAAVADTYMPKHIESFTPQQLQTSVVAWNKLGFTNPAVAAAAVRLSEVLPHLAPEFPEAETTAASRA